MKINFRNIFMLLLFNKIKASFPYHENNFNKIKIYRQCSSPIIRYTPYVNKNKSLSDIKQSKNITLTTNNTMLIKNIVSHFFCIILICYLLYII